MGSTRDPRKGEKHGHYPAGYTDSGGRGRDHQSVAGGAILCSLTRNAVSQQTGMLITAVVFVGITLIGGFWAAGLTNVVNVVVIYLGIVLAAVLSVQRIGGLEDRVEGTARAD